MKALVLGANGYLGRHLAHAARARGWDVRVTDLQPAAWDDDPAYRRCDIRRLDDLLTLDWDVDVVLAFSGMSGTTDTFDRYAEQIETNERGLVGVLEALRRRRSAGKVVFPSSRLVYKGARGTLLKEDAPKEPLTIYAAAKLAAEAYLALYRRVFGTRYAVFRICVPYGNLLGQGYSYGTMGFFLRHAMRGEDIPVYGSGDQRRTFSHVEDICEQILSACTLADTDNATLNVAGGDDLSIREAAELVAAHYGVGLRSTDWPELDLRCESGDTIFDSTAIESLTGYACRHHLAGWVRQLPAS